MQNIIKRVTNVISFLQGRLYSAQAATAEADTQPAYVPPQGAKVSIPIDKKSIVRICFRSNFVYTY